jgi:uncharacterized protein YihD (DUF1040 family)
VRDPNRIDEILEVIRAYWTANPDMRLGQIIYHSLRRPYPFSPPDIHYVFNVEDDILMSGLERLNKL